MIRYIVPICLSTWSLGLATMDDKLGPITESRRGYSGKVEYVKAVILPQHLDTGSRPSETSLVFFRKLVANGKNDVAGQLVPPSLGGPGDDTANIVPMNQRIKSVLYKKKVEDPIRNDVSAGNTVVLEVWPRYEGTIATRPNRFDVQAYRSDGAVVVDQTTIANPTS